MSPRPYRMARREAAALETRARILGACEALLIERGAGGVSMDAVAARADVARATVYHQFGSKRGLFEALVVEVQRRAGLDELASYLELDERASEILRRAIPAHCRYYAAEAPLFRLFAGLARVDADLGSVMEEQAGRWRAGIAALVARMDAEGSLRVGAVEAGAVIDVCLSFETFERLGIDDVAAAITWMAGAVVTF